MPIQENASEVIAGIIALVSNRIPGIYDILHHLRDAAPELILPLRKLGEHLMCPVLLAGIELFELCAHFILVVLHHLKELLLHFLEVRGVVSLHGVGIHTLERGDREV